MCACRRVGSNHRTSALSGQRSDQLSYGDISGDDRIRTCDGVTRTALAVRRLEPLGHVSMRTRNTIRTCTVLGLSQPPPTGWAIRAWSVRIVPRARFPAGGESLSAHLDCRTVQPKHEAIAYPCHGVEKTGFEPVASCLQDRRSDQLSYIPNEPTAGIEPATSALRVRRTNLSVLRRQPFTSTTTLHSCALAQRLGPHQPRRCRDIP